MCKDQTHWHFFKIEIKNIQAVVKSIESLEKYDTILGNVKHRWAVKSPAHCLSAYIPRIWV